MPKQAKTGPSSLEELFQWVMKEGEESRYESDTYLPPYTIQEYIDDEGMAYHILEKVDKIIRLKRKFSREVGRTPSPTTPSPAKREKTPPKTPPSQPQETKPSLPSTTPATPEEKAPSTPTPPTEEGGEKGMLKGVGEGERSPPPVKEGTLTTPPEEGPSSSPEEKAPPPVIDNPIKEYEAFKAVSQEKEKALKPVEPSHGGGEEDMEVLIPYVDKHKPVELGCPYFLNLDLEEEAEKLAARASKEVEMGGTADKDEIKRRIIELTKKLLTSKDAQEKEEIRNQIKELKSMLSVVSKGQKPTAVSFLEEYIPGELTKRLEEFVKNVRAYKESIDNSYQQAKNLAKGGEKEEEVERLYKEDMAALKEQALRCWQNMKDYLIRLYFKAIDLVEGNGRKEELKKVVEEKIAFFEKEFQRVLDLSPAPEAKEPARPAGEPKESKEEPKTAFEEYERAIKEVEGLRETELLHFLHSHDRKAFMEYIRGALDKEKALLYAKRLYAIKVKNVPEHIVNKYYEEVEV